MDPHLPKRRIRDRENAHAQWRIRLGADARGEFTNHLRKYPSREALGFLRARGQLGFPASMQTDACLGFCVMGRQSWDTARDHCDVFPYILIRIVGPVAKGRDRRQKRCPRKIKRAIPMLRTRDSCRCSIHIRIGCVQCDQRIGYVLVGIGRPLGWQTCGNGLPRLGLL